jgi:hypothetical protein
VAKTAQRRHQQERHMRRRLRYPAWAWVERLENLDDRAAMRSRASRQSVPCSCPLCRCWHMSAAQYKARRTVQEAAAYA